MFLIKLDIPHHPRARIADIFSKGLNAHKEIEARVQFLVQDRISLFQIARGPGSIPGPG